MSKEIVLSFFLLVKTTLKLYFHVKKVKTTLLFILRSTQWGVEDIVLPSICMYVCVCVYVRSITSLLFKI